MIGRRMAVLWLVVVCCAVNGASLFPGFIHDDHRIIEQNERIRDLTLIPEIVSTGYWSAADVPVPNLYRPVTILSFALGRAIHGPAPFGFRLVNLLLHVLNTWLVFALGSRLFRDPGGATGPVAGIPFLAAILFAVHPVHTEVLGEIVGRAELLAGACTLGAVLLFLRAREGETGSLPGPRPFWLYALSLSLYLLGALAKENAVVVPIVYVLFDWLLVRRRPAFLFHAAAAVALATLLAARVAVLGAISPPGAVHFIDNPIPHLGFLDGRLTALKVLARYAALLVWPAGLSIDYSYRTILPAEGWLDAGVLAGIALVVLFSLAFAWTMRRAPALAAALGFSAVMMAPVANLLFPIGTIMAERLLYLPSVGVCLAVPAVLASRLATKTQDGQRSGVWRIAVALVLVALVARSVWRLRDWRDDYTIFRAALAVAPDSVRTRFNYGASCEERGEDGEAIEAYERAIAIWPDFADAHYNLAGVLARQKNWPDAVVQYREALNREPANVRYLVNLAHALMAIDRHQEARDLLKRAIEYEPKSAYAYTNLGAAELALKDPEAAIAAYTQAVRLEPDNPDYLRNLGVARYSAHEKGAADPFRRALALRPDDPDLLDGLGLALLDAADAGGSVGALRQATTARPTHPVYRYHLGRALEQSGDLEGAAAQYREAIRLAPAVPFAYKALGLLLERRGAREEALAALEKAAELDPKGSVMDEQAIAVLQALRHGSRGYP